MLLKTSAEVTDSQCEQTCVRGVPGTVRRCRLGEEAIVGGQAFQALE